MPRILKGLVVVGLLVTGFLGCSTTEQITEKEDSNDGFYPAWYVQKGFSSDSTSFHGFATAISSDSVIAMANAELQARVNLESYIADHLESTREELEDGGFSAAGNPDFIITLRNAHNKVETAARSVERTARSENGYYRGFVQVSITKKELIDLLASGFSGKKSYWEVLRKAELLSN